MSRAIIAPYRLAAGALRLACQVTGLDFEQTPSGDWLWLGDGTPTGKFRVEFEVKGTAAAVQQCVPPAEHDADVWRVAVIMKSATSRSRRLTFLEPTDADFYRGSASYDTDQVRGTLVFGPAVVRTKQGAPVPPYGVHRAALLADGPPVQVMLEQPRMPPGGHLEVEYEDFSKSGSPSRAANADVLWSRPGRRGAQAVAEQGHPKPRTCPQQPGPARHHGPHPGCDLPEHRYSDLD